MPTGTDHEPGTVDEVATASAEIAGTEIHDDDATITVTGAERLDPLRLLEEAVYSLNVLEYEPEAWNLHPVGDLRDSGPGMIARTYAFTCERRGVDFEVVGECPEDLPGREQAIVAEALAMAATWLGMRPNGPRFATMDPGPARFEVGEARAERVQGPGPTPVADSAPAEDGSSGPHRTCGRCGAGITGPAKPDGHGGFIHAGGCPRGAA